MKDNFHQSMDDAPIGMRIVSQEGNTIYVNQAILDYYGYESLEELQKTPLKNRYTPESYAQAQKRKQQRDRGDFSDTDYKVSIVRKDGEIRHLEVIRKRVLWDGTNQFLIIYNDITRRTLAEEALVKQNKALLKLNRFSIELSDLSLDDHLETFITKKLKEISCAEAAVFSEYDASNRTMNVKHVEMVSGMIEKVIGLLGKQVTNIQFAVSDNMVREMTTKRIGMRKTLYAASFKAISRPAGAAIQVLLKVNRFIGVSYVFEGKLHGVSLLAMGRDQPDPPPEILENFVHLASASLERRLNQEILRVSEKKYRNLFNNAEAGMFISRLDGSEILDCNEKFLEILGYTHKEAKGTPSVNFWANRREREKMVQQIKTEGHVTDLECDLLNKQGEIINCILSNHLYPDTGFLEGSIQDITKRKMAEKEIRYLAQLLENVSDAVVSTDNEFNIVSWNKAAEKLYGWQADEVIGKVFNQVVPVKYKDADYADVLLQIRNEGLWKGEVIQQKKNGDEFYVQASVAVLKDQNGNPKGVISVNSDISDRKRMEETLRTSEAQLSNALQMACASHWDYDVGNDTFTFNDNFYRIFRTTAEKVGGYKMSSADYARRFCHPDDMAIVSKETKAAIESTDPNYNRQLEHRILYADGEVGYISVRFFIVKDSQGRTVRTYGVNQDITNRKQAEKIIREKEEQLRYVLNSAPITIFATDKQGVFTLHEGKAVKEVGMKPGENVGVSAFDLYRSISFKEHAGKETKGEDILNRALTGETVSGITELRGVCFDNQIGPILDENQKITGIVGVAIDISQRKQAEEALRESLIRYRELVENINSGVAVYEVIDEGMDFIFKDFNRAGERIDHDKRERLIGKRISEVRPGLEEFGLLDVLRRVWLTGKPESFPARMYKDERISGWYKNFVYKLPTGEIVAVFDNVSRQKQVEDDLSNALEMLKELYIYQDDAIENERKAISREIHDELGQLLSVLKIDLNWTKSNYVEGEEVIKKINSMIDIVNDTIKTVQRISSDLRPGLLDDLGLIPAMEWFCQEFEKRTGIKSHLNLGDFESSDEKINVTLYRILQEATTNVMRHANAKNLYVKCVRGEDSIFLEIIDDGIGMKLENMDSSKSLGLIGMRERIKQFGGSLDIKSTLHIGTTLSVFIPIS